MSESLAGSPQTKKSSFEATAGRRTLRWRALGCAMLMLSFYTMVVAAWLRPDFNRTELPDWRPVLALADTAWENGDGYEARYHYLQVERIASRTRNWEGLVAAACGFKRLDDRERRYSKAYAALLRATIVAQEAQSRQGMITIAKAFSTLGEHKAASLFLARIRGDWPIEKQEPLDFSLRGC